MFKTKEPYTINVTHEMWEGIDRPTFIIPKKLHKRRKPIVKIESPCKTTSFQINGNKSVEIIRGLEIYKGTFFTVKVTIE